MLKRFSITQQGQSLVKREDEKPVRIERIPSTPSRVHWREAMRRLTGNGEEAMLVLYNLMNGQPMVSRLPDGRESEPIVPSAEVRRAAAVDLLHMLHGKPVAQTEVLRAEQEAEEVERYRSYSTAELVEAASVFLERVDAPQALAEGEEEGE